MNFEYIIFEQSELITSLRAELERLSIENANLKARIAVLEKNSSNSSKPPSSDIVKPSRDFSPSHQHRRRKIGGQKGYTCHTRPQFSQDQVDDVIPLHLDKCPVCGGEVTLAEQESPRVHQQVEVVANPFIVTEYHQYRYRCEHCQSVNLNIKITLINENGQSAIIVDKTCLYEDWKKTSPTFSDAYSLPAALPGKFKVLLQVQNTDTQKKVSHELPLYILDPRLFSD
ncbi:MAG: DUF6444 domain-containing protein [Planctomycetaceae bacterium]|jgi:formate dehydrogenase maturation protein FdhE|nr:DUF6444 domain-containing protein [Planctomycetaceae bacterium]